MPQRVYELLPYLYVVVPLGIIVGAAWFDLRTRRGFGLGLLALVAIALSIFLAWQFTLAFQATVGTDDLGVGLVEVVFWLAVAVWALALVIAALVVAYRARQRGVIPVLIAITLVSAVAGYFAPTLLVGTGTARLDILWGILVPPLLAVLAYSFTRIARPDSRARVRSAVLAE